ncbi:MAG TPA: M20/M25/M40 family metallo-hydrolase [Vicinamibacterales bacterium]|nr:M20/M25/M40 family metallo-hydrolase [Vicinamibacterales bacterium]
MAGGAGPQVRALRLALAGLILLVPAAPPGSGLRAAAPGAAAQTASAALDRLARDLLAELVAIDTTDARGDNTRAAEAMAARLRAAGLPAEDVRVLAPAPRKGNLVARLRGTGRARPILLLAHLDVVEARREDWSVDPFALVERDGFFYGRGTTDDKGMAAIFVANLIAYRREGFRPSRDIILALTADEEGGDHNGVQFLLERHRDLIDAEFCINEGGDGQLRGGRRLLNEVQAAEKVYLSFRLEVRNPGGHSSLPVPDNAIYRLAGGLVRLSAFRFPARLNEVTRGFFERMAPIEGGQAGEDMARLAAGGTDGALTGEAAAAADRLSASSALYNALLRTTCVPTRLEAGHAENALPQTARAVVNCRLLPGEDPAAVERTLEGVLADAAIAVAPIGQARPSPPSPLRPDVMAAVERVTAALWPGVPVVPTMATGATDGLYLRNAGIPTYGVSGIFLDVDDVRAHGRDERVGVREFYEGREFLYRLVKELAR